MTHYRNENLKLLSLQEREGLRKFSRELLLIKLEMWQEGYQSWLSYLGSSKLNGCWPRREILREKDHEK